jgi:hypothetical protein
MKKKLELRLKINLFTPYPKGSKLIFFAPLGAGVNEENQWVFIRAFCLYIGHPMPLY